MNDGPTSGAAPANPTQSVDPAMLIEALRARGAERFDPVGLRFIEALARRTATQPHQARQVLERRLAKAVADFDDRFARAADEASASIADGETRFPLTAEALRQHYDAADFGGVRRLLARLQARGDGGPLAELLAHIGRHAPAGPAGGSGRGELKSVRQFRSTWSRLSADRQLSRALAAAPENAGPLNSHFLVVQALEQLRDISPHYVEQFMLHVDALLWLEQADSSRNPAQKKAVAGAAKKGKSRRGRAG